MTSITIAHLLFDLFIAMMAFSGVIFRRALRGNYDPPLRAKPRPYDWHYEEILERIAQADLSPRGREVFGGPDQAAG